MTSDLFDFYDIEILNENISARKLTVSNLKYCFDVIFCIGLKRIVMTTTFVTVTS
jgi:hypothetical protein